MCLIGQKIRPPNISFKNKRNIGGLMQLTIAQSSEVISELLQEHGLNKILEMVLNSLLKLEREGFLKESNNKLNKANGYRSRRVAGINKTITLSIPRDRLGHFYPTLLTIIKDQEEEVAKLAFSLYSKGLSTRDVSDIFETLYGDRYSKTTISRFNQSFMEELEDWRNRPLEKHYPILMIDAIYSKVRRDFSIENEATYIVIALREDLTRDIIALEHIPTESASGWEDLLRSLKKRGIETVDLVVADGLTGLENSVSKVFPNADFQKCVVHLKRYILNKISHKHKSEVAEDLKEIFNVSDSSYTKKEGIENMPEGITKAQMTEDIDNMKVHILNLISSLNESVVYLKEASKPIEPGCALGRLTRMEAIGEKGVNEAMLSSSKDRIIRLGAIKDRYMQESREGVHTIKYSTNAISVVRSEIKKIEVEPKFEKDPHRYIRAYMSANLERHKVLNKLMEKIADNEFYNCSYNLLEGNSKYLIVATGTGYNYVR